MAVAMHGTCALVLSDESTTESIAINSTSTSASDVVGDVGFCGEVGLEEEESFHFFLQ